MVYFTLENGVLYILCRVQQISYLLHCLEIYLYVVVDQQTAYAVSNIPQVLYWCMTHNSKTALFLDWRWFTIALRGCCVRFISATEYPLFEMLPPNDLINLKGVLFSECVWREVRDFRKFFVLCWMVVGIFVTVDLPKIP